MPSATAMFCDDIREEAGNKTSYMGVYGQTLFVPFDFPASIPKLCVSICYSHKMVEKVSVPVSAKVRFAGQDRSLFEVILPVSEMLKAAPAKDANGHDVTNIMTRFNLVFAPLTVNEPSTLEVIVTSADGPIEAASLEISRSHPTTGLIVSDLITRAS
jgi:hypothetical protein